MISVKDAVRLFMKKFPNTNADTIFDYGKCYYVDNCVKDDFVDDGYTIDKKTGSISSIDFFEWTDLLKSVGDNDIPEYRFSEVLTERAS